MKTESELVLELKLANLTLENERLVSENNNLRANLVSLSFSNPITSNTSTTALTHQIPTTTLTNKQILRYSRQLVLPTHRVTGQLKLLNTTVVIVGLGGLGCPCALYLATSGVGRLVIVDGDKVEFSNICRYVTYLLFIWLYVVFLSF